MGVKVKTSDVKNFVAIDENIYKALELMGVKMDLIGFKILNDGEWIIKSLKERRNNYVW